ncbi:MAG TPA: hypothetical protein VN668_02650 [Stellaceae bacterium]|nr:hypothetical protein [Stellaceae bacterium]
MFVAAVLSAASLVPLIWLEARPRGGDEVAAVFPPWTGRERAFAQAIAAGGLVVREGARDWILVVQGDQTDIGERLYASGAWLVIDPVAFGGCLTRAHVDGKS